jgi:hypothetical protein
MILFVVASAMLLSGACGVGEVVFEDVPTLIECGEPIQLNWTYVGNASSVFRAGDNIVIELSFMSMVIKAEVVSPRPLRYPATGAVVRFAGPRLVTPVDAFLGLFGSSVGTLMRTGSAAPSTYKSQVLCCSDCCRAAPNECGHVNSTFQCLGRRCAPAYCPTPSAAPGLLGCPCSTNVALPGYERCAGDYACDTPTEHGLCTALEIPQYTDRCSVASGIDSCAQRNASYSCLSTVGSYCRICGAGVTPFCRCDLRRSCTTRFCVDGRCGLIGCRWCPCGRWRTCAAGLVCNADQMCETAPVMNSTEQCNSLSDTAARQCDYAAQQNDIDDLLRSAPADEGLPVQLSQSVATACSKLRQVLICRARVYDGSSSGCVDAGIGATVSRLCEAIPAARLAALNCGLCEPEPCDSATPGCLRGMACIGGKCIIDPQYAICRNAASMVGAACPDLAKFEDKETVQLAAKVGAMTNVTDTACAALLAAHTNRSACYARVYADAGCMLPQTGPRHSLCTNDDMAKRIAAIGCSICTSLPTITFAPVGTNGPVAPVSSISLVPSDINAGCLRAPFLALALVVGAIGFI